MKHFFYPRLAFTNIKKNAKVYIPYLLTSMFTVMMFYIMQSLAMNTSFINDPSSSGTLLLILQLGVIVIVVFAIIFLFYINSFIMKRRKKEVALYNILGMEKKHVMTMMFCETLMTTFVSIIGGILLGILLSKLVFLCLVNLIQISTSMAFEISSTAIMWTLILFIPIYMIAYLFNVIQIKLANPIELLRGSQTGEKEPKTKWIMTIIGILSLGSGYYLAQIVEEPMMAMMLFFVAVILVIIGTYCLFTAGSITILKLLKKNKRFYYQTRHFTAVSQMVYRMKQNAVGLASICILYTCILVMLSSTVSLYVSIDDTSQLILDHDMEVESRFSDFDNKTQEERQDIKQELSLVKKELLSQGIEMSKVYTKEYYSVIASIHEKQIKLGYNDGLTYTAVIMMSVDEYNQSFGKNLSLNENEVYVASEVMDFDKSIQIEQNEFQIKGKAESLDFLPVSNPSVSSWLGVVFQDENVLMNVLKSAEGKTTPQAKVQLALDLKDQSQAQEASELVFKIGETHGFDLQSRYYAGTMFTEMYGSLFFLGIFLGILFLMAAILIMYYKQLNEGYEDQKRFEIMQNVGMSKKEVKQSIRSQVLIFFFLPLGVSVIHMFFAFNLIVRMFGYLVLSGENVFILCTLVSIAVLVIIYSIVYSLTARTYYRIVKN